ncbi:hypothetical protein P153DRAFT_73535 [Dothidotthia symphoricarpi CBS 119687]|uniref:Uncharacterized protein n=1 Tax=Dothidotthia symphoricarpi CBS 119687 TaxID=1392245 RepID=A0A6A6A7Z4_9PLEO|nr:uncharacterized protein P153DRAFT_73535 [Dothidotthia symphoricarpi CBS 119687]KAF2126937.1 hypothetical protein P153DRAFT_73535 [Dothidotthia symphoricarpi CBS 119687]
MWATSAIGHLLIPFDPDISRSELAKADMHTPALVTDVPLNTHQRITVFRYLPCAGWLLSFTAAQCPIWRHTITGRRIRRGKIRKKQFDCFFLAIVTGTRCDDACISNGRLSRVLAPRESFREVELSEHGVALSCTVRYMCITCSLYNGHSFRAKDTCNMCLEA